MALPAVDPDPDPTTQIPWPGARKRSDRGPGDSPVSSPPANPADDSSRRPSVGSRADANGKRRRLSTVDLINLSISMAGAQIAWTVELGYLIPALP
jgi:solute carrier family 45 protein 1/2/4